MSYPENKEEQAADAEGPRRSAPTLDQLLNPASTEIDHDTDAGVTVSFSARADVEVKSSASLSPKSDPEAAGDAPEPLQVDVSACDMMSSPVAVFPLTLCGRQRRTKITGTATQPTHRIMTQPTLGR